MVDYYVTFGEQGSKKEKKEQEIHIKVCPLDFYEKNLDNNELLITKLRHFDAILSNPDAAKENSWSHLKQDLLFFYKNCVMPSRYYNTHLTVEDIQESKKARQEKQKLLDLDQIIINLEQSKKSLEKQIDALNEKKKTQEPFLYNIDQEIKNLEEKTKEIDWVIDRNKELKRIADNARLQREAEKTPLEVEDVANIKWETYRLTFLKPYEQRLEHFNGDKERYKKEMGRWLDFFKKSDIIKNAINTKNDHQNI